MILFPYASRTIVLALSAEDSEELLKAVTKRVHTYSELIEDRYRESLYKFNGNVKSNKFSLSKVVKYPQNYLPYITGTIEGTKTGSIVFVSYELFQGTKVLFFLWTFMTMFLTAFFFFVNIHIGYGITALAMFLLNYIVALANFNIHVKDCHQTLVEVFEV